MICADASQPARIGRHPWRTRYCRVIVRQQSSVDDRFSIPSADLICKIHSCSAQSRPCFENSLSSLPSLRRSCNEITIHLSSLCSINVIQGESEEMPRLCLFCK